MKDEIIIYQDEEASTHIEVKIEDETVWLTQAQMVELFQSTKQNLSLHINNVYKEGELNYESTVKEYLTVQMEGKRKVKRMISYYCLDVIISVGYRVKSQRGTQFRIWANKVLKDYLLKGYAINHRFEQIENNMHTMQSELGEIKLQLKTNLLPSEGVFFDGQIFDAYVFVTGLIKSAKTSIILIDNFIDESVLLMLSKRNENISATVLTKSISKQFELDLKKHNQQYPAIEVKIFTKSHDRFLIIDNKKVYHIGASIKDLGKKLFAFSNMEKETLAFLNKISSC